MAISINTKRLFVAVVAFLAALAMLHVATQDASASSSDGCQYMPATVVTSSISTTFSTTVIKKMIKVYEKKHHVVVAVNMRANGVKSFRGCIDPVKKGWIKPGQKFKNTRKNGSRFTDAWQNGRKICHPRRVKIGGLWYWMGTKDNCGNAGILIRACKPHRKGKHACGKIRGKVKKVITVKTYKEFYIKYILTTTATQGSVSYTCPAGWTSTTIGGQPMCKKCPPPPQCTYLASPEHVFPGMSRWIDLKCTYTSHVEVDNTTEWRGFVVFHETQAGGVWRFKYVAPNPWSGPDDSGHFTPYGPSGVPGNPVLVTVLTPPDNFGPS